jgi:DHA2 family multidrug resistance protein
LVAGAAVLMLALWMLSNLSPQTSGSDLFLPLIVRAFGTVFMFLPLQLASLGPVPKKDVAAATGFFNLTRQLGGSIGVAILTVLLDHRNKFHASVLREKLVADDPGLLSRVSQTARGLSQGGHSWDAPQRALALMEGAIRREASVLSFNDTFLATGVLVLIALPLVFLLGKPQTGAKVEMGH